MTIVIILAIIVGIIHGSITIDKTRKGLFPPTGPSTSLIEFIFLNK